MFKQFRPLIKIGAALERIAVALEYFAVVDAHANNRMFIPRRPGWLSGKDESELMNSDPVTVKRLRHEEHELMLQQGYEAVDREEFGD